MAHQIGTRTKFSEERSKTNGVISLKYGLAFLVAFFFCSLAILIIEVSHINGDNCGIPLHLWLDIYFVISIIGAFIALNVVWMAYAKPYWAYDFEFWRRVIFAIILAAWVIYGYILYFSDDNNC